LSEAKPSALIARLWRNTVARYTLDIAALAPVLAIVAAAAVVYAWIVQKAIDALAAGRFSQLEFVPITIIAATIVRAIAMYAQASMSQGLALKVLRDLQGAMFGALMGADYARFAREDTGRLVSRFTNDINVVSEGLVKGLQATMRDSLMLLGALGYMLWTDWLMTLILAALYLLAAGPLAAIARRARRQTEAAQVQLGALTAVLAESLGAIRFIKTYALEGREKARAESAFEERRKLAMHLARNRASTEPLMEIIGGLAFAAILLAASWRIYTGAMTVGALAGVITAIGVASPAARALGSFNTVFNEALAALARVFSVLDEAPRVIDAPTAKPLIVRDAAVTFKNVSFAYPDAPAAIRDISFSVSRGQTLALVGPSGAGKSTIFNLIPRLFDVTGGSVAIDGQNVRETTLASLRASIALVSQDVALFNDSVRANIAFGRPGASEDEIRAAAEAAAADSFIRGLPQGYDTLVGERGGMLSGGERQRIALARAFLRDAPILLLDEATSALDAESEARVQEALARLEKGRTTLVIAHRLSTVRNADMILVLEDGAIRERGTHSELMAKSGLYARLARMQFQADDAVAAS
jgi:ATP-binding cassette, subfamily B, bacterial MsbA